MGKTKLPASCSTSGRPRRWSNGTSGAIRAARSWSQLRQPLQVHIFELVDHRGFPGSRFALEQVFAGVVMGIKGRGLNKTFIVRRISYGEGVERVFPFHSSRVDKVEVERAGSVRRAKLTYLRGRIGKGALAVKEMPRATEAAAAKN